MPKQVVKFGRRKCDPRCVYTARTHNYWLAEVQRREEQRADTEEFLELQRRISKKLELIREVLDGIRPFEETIWWYADDMRYIRKLSQQDYDKIEQMAKNQIEYERQEREAKKKLEELLEFWERRGDNTPHRRTRRSKKKRKR